MDATIVVNLIIVRDNADTTTESNAIYATDWDTKGVCAQAMFNRKMAKKNVPQSIL